MNIHIIYQSTRIQCVCVCVFEIYSDQKFNCTEQNKYKSWIDNSKISIEIYSLSYKQFKFDEAK